MSVKTMYISGYCCDKCGHKWVGRKKNTIESFNPKDLKRVDKELEKANIDWIKNEEIKKKYNFKKPNICPKCKSKKWDEKKIISKITPDIIKIMEKSCGKGVANSLRCQIDKKFHRQEVLKQIDRTKIDLKRHKSLVRFGEDYLKSLENELEQIKNEPQSS